MDVKNRQLYGKVMATGIAEVPVFEGSVQKIMHESIIWMMGQRIQMDSHGELQVNLRISNKPMGQVKDSAMDDFKNLPGYAAFMANVREATPEEEAQIAAMNLDPWRGEEGWKRLTHLHSTQTNYETSPEEYARLWTHYESTYPQSLSAAKKRSR